MGICSSAITPSVWRSVNVLMFVVIDLKFVPSRSCISSLKSLWLGKSRSSDCILRLSLALASAALAVRKRAS